MNDPQIAQRYIPNQRGEQTASSQASVNTGNIILWCNTGVPDNSYLKCDGTFYNPTAYPALYQTIGGTYGLSTIAQVVHFAVPDLRGRQAIGRNGNTVFPDLSGALGGTGGATRVDLSANQIPLHNHTQQIGNTAGAIPGNPFPVPARNYILSADTTSADIYDMSGNIVQKEVLKIIQPYLTMNWVIKT